MKNLLETLVSSGLSEDQAIKTIQVTYQWTSVNYPVLATISETAILKPSGIVPIRRSIPGGLSKPADDGNTLHSRP